MLEGEVETAIELFEDLKRTGTLSLRACNTILAIQPTAETAATMAAMADTVLEDMVAEGLVPTEPTFSNSIRLHMRVGNVERAEQLVQVVMESDEMILRLRTCSPLLLWYIQRNDIDKAVKLCEAMMLQGVVATENELVPLLCALYAAGQVRKRTNKVLNWMSEALMTVSPEKLEEMRSIPSAEFKTTEQLLEAGEIELLGLSNSQTEFIRDAVRAHAAKTGAGPALEGFGKWLRRNPPFDYVIDCGNVAWHGQARFCAEQVEAMRRELVGRGARVLLVLSSHSRHQ